MSTVLEAPPPIVASSPQGAVYTAADLLVMEDGEQFELVDGELVEIVMSPLSGWVGGEVFGQIRDYVRQHGGWAFTDGIGYRCHPNDSNRVRKPDASYIRADRLSAPSDEFISVPPDLAVEVVSPSDIYYEVEAKVDEYLRAGVRLVWVIHPPTMTVRVFQPGRRATELGPEDDLTGGETLPGFSCRVRSLFPPSPQPAQ